MDTSQIKSIDDFEKLSTVEKFELKSEHPDFYKQLFHDGGVSLNGSTTFAPKAEPNKYLQNSAASLSRDDFSKYSAELNFFPSDIKTPNDFERLTDVGKMYLKQYLPDQYKRIWN